MLGRLVLWKRVSHLGSFFLSLEMGEILRFSPPNQHHLCFIYRGASSVTSANAEVGEPGSMGDSALLTSIHGELMWAAGAWGTAHLNPSPASSNLCDSTQVTNFPGLCSCHL